MRNEVVSRIYKTIWQGHVSNTIVLRRGGNSNLLLRQDGNTSCAGHVKLTPTYGKPCFMGTLKMVEGALYVYTSNRRKFKVQHKDIFKPRRRTFRTDNFTQHRFIGHLKHLQNISQILRRVVTNTAMNKHPTTRAEKNE